MRRPLALHHLTLLDVSAPELVDIAAQCGTEEVCFFTHSPIVPVPGAEFFAFPQVTPENVKDVKARLDGHGLACGNVEFFPVTVSTPYEVYARAFELSAAIGAPRAVTHIHDLDPTRSVESLGRLCELAGSFGLRLGLEFMGITPACNSIQKASWFVGQMPLHQIGIGCDALHLTRTGGKPQDIRAIDPAQFCYAQICDGRGLDARANYTDEFLDRVDPGDGDWPVREILASLPAHTALDVEVPSSTQQAQGRSALDRARDAVRKARAIVDALPPELALAQPAPRARN